MGQAIYRAETWHGASEACDSPSRSRLVGAARGRESLAGVVVSARDSAAGYVVARAGEMGMICPNCASPVCDFPILDTYGVCPLCARSLVKVNGEVRLATAGDIRELSPKQVKELRLARPAAWRNDVRARHAQIVGGR